MTPSLDRWIGEADALRHIEDFKVPQPSLGLVTLRSRLDDYYLSLVGDLFDRMHQRSEDGRGWARLGNALAQIAANGHEAGLRESGISKGEATLFAAAAFYCGGFPASSYLTMRSLSPGTEDSETHRACFDLLARPTTMHSQMGLALLEALRAGDSATLSRITDDAQESAAAALVIGPHEWIPARLLERLLQRFARTNVRAVLPDGESAFWTPLVESLLDRRPPQWEFFPSQIEAIERGLLESGDTFALQMPTGAGKTALCEVLLYRLARRSDSEVAVLLVPYRSLASELRGTVVKRLNAMGASARCAYGGTVPSGDEVRDLTDTRVLVATPEALSGLLGAAADFLRRISLVICDEGHLLDGGARGVGLELLLARMKARESGAPRFVFVSAIVPNIEEINVWLGGHAASVVRSDYRPAIAEFAVLRRAGKRGSSVALEMHPHEAPPVRVALEGFLRPEDFHWTNPETGRRNTYAYASIKTLAIASARKALAMGATAVFAANKRGDQGVVGLAEELVEQLKRRLPLPDPATFVDGPRTAAAVDYLEREYGKQWIGSQALAAGAVLHHGDIPQETREVVEALLRHGSMRLAICTNTLAEGVNLPIRTLVLYSIQRRQKSGRPANLLARDIKNLVGRAGRAGATTKGLVICVNEQQWPLLERVARQLPGEPVRGALLSLLDGLRSWLARRNLALTNPLLENSPQLHTLVDGVDATLIDLVTEEIGEERLAREAIRLADETFAAVQADQVSRQLLRTVFELRSQRVLAIRGTGRLAWLREAGAHARLLERVESGLLPRRARWDDVADPVDAGLVGPILDWAWSEGETKAAVRDAYRLKESDDISLVQGSFFELVKTWLAGGRFEAMAANAGLSVDDALGIHTHVVTFVLQTLVEQGVALLAKFVGAQGQQMASAVALFPEHLRFGVPTGAARVLAAGGVRHRGAAVSLGRDARVTSVPVDSRSAVFSTARRVLHDDEAIWRTSLGNLVFENTLWDLSFVTGEVPG